LSSTLASADDAALVTEIVDTFYKSTEPIRLSRQHANRRGCGRQLCRHAGSVGTQSRGALQWQQNSRNVRFSNDGASDRPGRAPGNPRAWPSSSHARRDRGGHGILAVKFFPVATGEEFRDLLVAITRVP